MSQPTYDFVRIAREGATMDGRSISCEQIDQMAENYNPEIFGARIWLEHFRGLLPDSIFPALGDVLALKAENVAVFPAEPRALYPRHTSKCLFRRLKNRTKVSPLSSSSPGPRKAKLVLSFNDKNRLSLSFPKGKH